MTKVQIFNVFAAGFLLVLITGCCNIEKYEAVVTPGGVGERQFPKHAAPPPDTTYKLYPQSSIFNSKAVIFKQEGGHNYILIPSRLKLKQSSWVWKRGFWGCVCGSRLLIELRGEFQAPAVLEAESMITKRDPSAQFLRPWMSDVSVDIPTAFLSRQELTHPGPGFPLDELLIAWNLDAQDTKELNVFKRVNVRNVDAAIQGQMKFFEQTTGQLLTIGFSIPLNGIAVQK